MGSCPGHSQVLDCDIRAEHRKTTLLVSFCTQIYVYLKHIYVEEYRFSLMFSLCLYSSILSYWKGGEWRWNRMKIIKYGISSISSLTKGFIPISRTCWNSLKLVETRWNMVKHVESCWNKHVEACWIRFQQDVHIYIFDIMVCRAGSVQWPGEKCHSNYIV